MAVPKRDINAERRQLGRDAIISESEAVRLLPGRDADIRKWLRANGLVSTVMSTKRCVHWGSVVAAFNRQSKPKHSSQRLPRVTLS